MLTYEFQSYKDHHDDVIMASRIQNYNSVLKVILLVINY